MVAYIRAILDAVLASEVGRSRRGLCLVGDDVAVAPRRRWAPDSPRG